MTFTEWIALIAIVIGVGNLVWNIVKGVMDGSRAKEAAERAQRTDDRASRADEVAERTRKAVEDREAPNLTIANVTFRHEMGATIYVKCSIINGSSLPDAIMEVSLCYEYEGQKKFKDWQILIQHEHQRALNAREQWPNTLPVNVPPLSTLSFACKGNWLPMGVIHKSTIPQAVLDMEYTIIIKTLRSEEPLRQTVKMVRRGG